jgi:hypothetical protein
LDNSYEINITRPTAIQMSPSLTRPNYSKDVSIDKKIIQESKSFKGNNKDNLKGLQLNNDKGKEYLKGLTYIPNNNKDKQQSFNDINDLKDQTLGK